MKNIATIVKDFHCTATDVRNWNATVDGRTVKTIYLQYTQVTDAAATALANA